MVFVLEKTDFEKAHRRGVTLCRTTVPGDRRCWLIPYFFAQLFPLQTQKTNHQLSRTGNRSNKYLLLYAKKKHTTRKINKMLHKYHHHRACYIIPLILSKYRVILAKYPFHLSLKRQPKKTDKRKEKKKKRYEIKRNAHDSLILPENLNISF